MLADGRHGPVEAPRRHGQVDALAPLVGAHEQRTHRRGDRPDLPQPARIVAASHHGPAHPAELVGHEVEVPRHEAGDRHHRSRHPEALGADHPEALVDEGRLAWAYLHAGRFEEAIAVYEHVVPRQERVIGADHPDTLITVHGLASAYEAVGRTAEALTRYEHVARRLEAVLGPDQPLTLSAARGLERARRLATPN